MLKGLAPEGLRPKETLLLLPLPVVWEPEPEPPADPEADACPYPLGCSTNDEAPLDVAPKEDEEVSRSTATGVCIRGNWLPLGADGSGPAAPGPSDDIVSVDGLAVMGTPAAGGARGGMFNAGPWFVPLPLPPATGGVYLDPLLPGGVASRGPLPIERGAFADAGRVEAASS